MLNKYKIAFRNITRNKVFSTINIAGLSLGIAVFLLISQFVASEWGSNRFHKNFERIYRVAAVSKVKPIITFHQVTLLLLKINFQRSKLLFGLQMALVEASLVIQKENKR